MLCKIVYFTFNLFQEEKLEQEKRRLEEEQRLEEEKRQEEFMRLSDREKVLLQCHCSVVFSSVWPGLVYVALGVDDNEVLVMAFVGRVDI